MNSKKIKMQLIIIGVYVQSKENFTPREGNEKTFDERPQGEKLMSTNICVSDDIV